MGYPQTSVPNTAHSVFYAYSIHVNGFEIGSLERFGASSSRTTERIREILFSRGAEVKEIVWGGTDTTVNLSRVELYSAGMLEAFGYEIYALEDFNNPVNITEICTLPDGSTRTLTFVDAVASSWGKDIDTGSVRRIETMEFQIRKVTGRRSS